MLRHSKNLLSIPLFVHIQVILLCLCTSNIDNLVAEAGDQQPAETNRTSSHFEGVFAFGDSLLDTGNNNNLVTPAKCNFLPYGRDFSGGVPTGRFSNGKVYSDFIVEALGIKHLLPAYLDPNLRSEDLSTGVCFASGSSGYDPRTASAMGVLRLSDQLVLFREYKVKLTRSVGEERAEDIIANSLYLISAGTNDILITYSILSRQGRYDFESYAALLVSYASTFFKELYSLGARRFGIASVSAIGCVPLERNAGGSRRECLEVQNQRGKIFNSHLLSKLDSIKKDLPDAKLVLLDVFTPLLELNQHPQNTGFKAVKNGCCGTGTLELAFLCNPTTSPSTCINASNHVYWDAIHPSERAQNIIASRSLEFITSL